MAKLNFRNRMKVKDIEVEESPRLKEKRLNKKMREVRKGIAAKNIPFGGVVVSKKIENNLEYLQGKELIDV
jgi:hypothetical protein